MLKKKLIKILTASLVLSTIFISFNWLNTDTVHASTSSNIIDNTIVRTSDIVTDNGVWKSESFYNGDKYTHALPYRIFIPDEYDPNQPYSLVLFLHGAGERGTNNTDQILIQPKGPNLFASAETQSKYPTIVVAPQCPNNEQWVDTPWENGSYNLDNVPVSDEMQMVVDIIDNVKSEYNIDENRMYSTGISMGGYGTWNVNLLFPDMFAAMIPICGASDPSKASLIKDKGIWAFHGDADSVVPVSGAREMISALKSTNASPVYTEYSGVSHNSWDRAYSTSGLVDWMYSHVKNDPTGKENLSLNKITTSSGTSSSLHSDNAIDGDKSDKKSRWSSNISNDAWMQVDLGESQYVDEVRIFWDEAYGKKYKILLSEDGLNYNEVFSEENGTSGFDLIEFEPTKARYVKFQGVESAKSNGYSFLEFEIYNDIPVAPPTDIVVSKPSNLTASNTSSNGTTLSWTAPNTTTGLTNYIIYKDGKIVDTLDSNATTYTVNHLRSNTNYGFKVASKYSNGDISKPISLNIRTKK
ncbi:MAG: discoidin domain-containing protein [Clostridium sp.]